MIPIDQLGVCCSIESLRRVVERGSPGDRRRLLRRRIWQDTDTRAPPRAYTSSLVMRTIVSSCYENNRKKKQQRNQNATDHPNGLRVPAVSYCLDTLRNGHHNALFSSATSM
jgi:hypothetical protein